MAEIRVEQRKRGLGWLWLLILVALLALAAWYFMGGMARHSAAPAAPDTTAAGAPAPATTP